MKLKDKVITVDFDGTIVDHCYPDIGDELPYAFDTLKKLKKAGAKLILWTCREDNKRRKYLTEAVDFCRENGVEFDAINCALESHDFRDPSECELRKPHGHYFIDDRNIGGFLGWDTIAKVLLNNQNITWSTADTDTHVQLKKEMNVGETSKAKERRIKEGWFEKFAPENLPGIDIGCQHDPLNETFRRWDILFGDSDATFMKEIPDNTFHTVYASHILEHLHNPIAALQNWYRITKPGGHMIVLVPHRDLYEKRTELPSQWNSAHKFFYLPIHTEAPCTLSLNDLVLRAISDADIVSFKVLDEGYKANGPDEHCEGEFSIELIVKKS